jgi:hypothetical protein
MGDLASLGSAFYNLVNTASGTVPAYYALAPQGSTRPYVIVQRQSAVDKYTFDSRGIEAIYQVRAVSDKQWPAQAQTVFDATHSGVQGGTMTVAGFTAILCRRESTFEYRETDGFWNVGGLYRVWVVT